MSYRDNDDDERQPLTSDDSVIQIGSDDSEDSQDANQDSFIFPSSSARAASSSSRLSLSSSSHIGDLPSKVGAKLHAPQSMFQNLDLFFTRVYDYYQKQGYYNAVLAGFLHILNLAFIIGFSTFLIGFVDYHILFSTYDINASIGSNHITEFHPFSIVCLVVFSLWWLSQFGAFIRDASKYGELYTYFNEDLKIEEKMLRTMKWNEVVETLIAFHRSNQSIRFQIDELAVTNYIMRKDNYMIALFNQEVIQLESGFLPMLSNNTLLTNGLNWNLQTCLLNNFFAKDAPLEDLLAVGRKPAIVEALQRSFRIWGVINLILSPFILVFLVIYFFFRYTQEFYRNPKKLGMREWTLFSKWKFREFNELPHVFERRLQASYQPAEKYLVYFPVPMLTTVARFLSFVSGAFAAVLLFLSIIDEQLLLKMELGGKAIVWWIGVLGTVFAMSRAYIPEENLVYDPNKLMKDTSRAVRYIPDSWRHKAHL
eukprot:TRINITY_DN308_c0_g1_i4.p1 TRINITY_DN308_c0_g1~~TRINITY_DN308_c0_g1_i4.p1  ORF type:complete len:482 (-),score=155.91 TRINITY_DN308_c0_g1_i4:179-1624(-)